MKLKIILFLLVFFQLLLFYSCSTTAPDGNILSLTYKHERGSPLEYTFTVRWDNLDHGYIFLVMIPDNSASSSKEWYMGSISSNSSSVTDNVSFPINNPSPTTYTVYAELRSSNYPPYSTLKTSSIYSVEISFKKFNIIQLAMTGDNLWPNYSSNNYIGYKQRDAAFGDANTVVNVVHNYSNLSTADLSTAVRLIEWTINKSGGNYNNPPYFDLDPNIAIICGVENIPNNIDVSPPLDDNTHGFTWSRTDQVPAMSWIRYDKIRTSYTADYDFTRAATGTAIHELGHARGIRGDDPNINPPHGGSNIDVCVMHSPYDINWFTNTVFCSNHIQFIKNITW